MEANWIVPKGEKAPPRSAIPVPGGTSSMTMARWPPSKFSGSAMSRLSFGHGYDL